MNTMIESFYKVIPFKFRYRKKSHIRYPEFKLMGDDALFFMTLDEAEHYVQKMGQSNKNFKDEVDYCLHGVYAYVVIEIPLGMEISTDVMNEYLSLRIYLRDGSLWGVNLYANINPRRGSSQLMMDWRTRHLFWGRKPEEIKFKPGDIVEVLGCPGNDYWSNDRVDLAIVVSTPATVDEVAQRKQQYMAAHDGFDVTDASLAYEFNADLDTYELIPYGSDFVDHAPTIFVFEPTEPVSPRRKKAMELLLDRHHP